MTTKIFENPIGTEGFEFVEFTSPDPSSLIDTFKAMGFRAVSRHRSLDILRFQQGGVTFLVNQQQGGRVERFRSSHGPSISAMGFRVEDSQRALSEAARRGATAAATATDLDCALTGLPAIEGIGGSRIFLVDQATMRRFYAENFVSTEEAEVPTAAGLTVIDHLTHNVLRGNLSKWADFYERVFNFREIRHFDIEGQVTGLRSKAMTSPDGNIRIPLNESQDDKSQIEEFLRDYRGEGIQHIALGTTDIYAMIASMRHRGVRFQSTPASYYSMIDSRLPGHGENIARMQELGILIDGAPESGGGLLLQIFTQNMVGPCFFEIIQRKGNEGFGEGNFKALFESLEQDQLRRGVL